jgi:Xaa-Pro dipeptidase
MLTDKVMKYYLEDNDLNCAETMIYGANEEYDLNMSEDALKTMSAFGGGMAVESVCGALTGAVAALGVMFTGDKSIDKDRRKEIIADFYREFEKKLGTDNCELLKEKYRDEVDGCLKVVELSAEVLEEIVSKYDKETTMNIRYMNKLIESIKESDLDAMFIAPSEELNFLAGFSPHICERIQGLFIKEDGDYFYFCNRLTRDEVEENLPRQKVYSWLDNKGFVEDLQNLMEEKELIGKTIGVNSTARAFNILDVMEKIDVKFKNGKSILEDMRIIKTEEEIKLLKEAGRKTDEVMEEVIDFIKPGMTEGEIVERVKCLFEEKDMVCEFAIVACGPHTALPHYSGTKGVVKNKDVVLMDIGGKYKGLTSDMTRTVFVGGASEEEVEVYNIVLESNKKGISMANRGIVAKEVDNAARKIIDKKGYGEYNPTRLGHGIGYSVHEAPYINGYNNLILENGMAFSIEPGIYMKDKFGVRIEDIVIIEDGKAVRLNNFTKEMIII